MSQQIDRKVVKLLIQSIILSSTFFKSIPCFSQVDTLKIRREVFEILKKNGIKNPSFELKISSANQKGGQTAFIINNYNGITNITVVEDIPYSEYSKMDITGLSIHYLPPIIGPKTTLSSLMENVLHKTPSNQIEINKSDSALLYLDTVINKFPHFPYGYFCKSFILSGRNDNDWVQWAKKARDIFEVTTKIEGHFSGQDEDLAKLRKILAL